MKGKEKTNQSIGFIGAGNMGLPMLKNLVSQGYDVKVYDINPKITKKLEITGLSKTMKNSILIVL